MTISFSRHLAVVLGILTPLAETIRRWSTWRENSPALLDDYFLGAFLLYGAWRASRDLSSGQRFLAAAWGFMCGMAFLSFFEQLHRYRLGIADPAPIVHTTGFSRWFRELRPTVPFLKFAEVVGFTPL